jgi:cysteine-rich repeat protein
MHNMRSLLIASIAALAFPACVQDISGGTGAGSDQTGGVCGDMVVGAGESCDDGNTTSGDGCDATCHTETSATPKIAGSMNAATFELFNPGTATLALTALGGFTGTANLAYSLVDANGTAISAATIDAPATADLTSGTATVAINVTVPLSVTGTEIQGSLKVNITSSADPVTVTAAADIMPILTVEYAAGTGVVPNAHTDHGMTFAVVHGTIIHIKNSDTVVHRTHGSGAQGSMAPFAHELLSDPTAGKAGGTYAVPTLNVTPSATVYQLGCHDHPGTNNAEYMNFTVM